MKHEGLVSHYTSVSILPEFLKKDAFFYGTHTDFLNDPTEKKYALTIFDSKIEQSEYKKYAGNLYEDFSIYTASLSIDMDNINQWRAYTSQETGGFSIQFFAKELVDAKWSKRPKYNEYKNVEEQFKKGFGCGLKVCYEPEEVDVFYEKAMKAIKHCINNSDNQGSKDHVIIYWLSLYRALFSCFVKNENYKDEKEFRVAYVTSQKNGIEIIGGKPRKKLFAIQPNKIHSIIVSPHGNVARNRRFAEVLCENVGLSSTIVKLSQVPFRNE